MAREFQTLLQEKNNSIELEFKYNNKMLLDLKNVAKGALKEEVYDKKHFEVFADHFRLSRVLYNLVDNANKFTESGTIKILVEMWESDVKFSMIDSGKGLMRKYFQSSSTNSQQNPPGNGFGAIPLQKHCWSARWKDLGWEQQRPWWGDFCIYHPFWIEMIK